MVEQEGIPVVQKTPTPEGIPTHNTSNNFGYIPKIALDNPYLVASGVVLTALGIYHGDSIAEFASYAAEQLGNLDGVTGLLGTSPIH